MRTAIVAAVIVLEGCTTLSVRAPVCSPPPIPRTLLVECPPAIMPTGPTLAEFYENAVANAAGPWRDCVRLHGALVAVVEYSETICPKIAADNANPRAWWEFWK